MSNSQPIHRKPLPPVDSSALDDMAYRQYSGGYQAPPDDPYSAGLGIAPAMAAPRPAHQPYGQPPVQGEWQQATHATLKKTPKIAPAADGGKMLPPPPRPDQANNHNRSSSLPQNGGYRPRSSSLQQPAQAHLEPSHGARLQPRGTSPMPDPRGRSSSAQPPTQRGEHSRVVSTSDTQSRPDSFHSSEGTQSPNRESGRGRLRRSWLPGGQSRSNSHDYSAGGGANAWIMSPGNHAEYNTSFLTNGDKVPELWNETGSLYVYLFPQGSGFGPSFKVSSAVVESSIGFNELIQSVVTPASSTRSRAKSFGGRNSLSVEDASRRQPSPPNSPPAGAESPLDSRLYIPMAQMSQSGQLLDIERFIAVRNLFAFLTGQPLVGTKSHGTMFSAFLQIAALLREFRFENADGSSFGEAVDLSFGFFMEQYNLADVRHSREKTVEALVLGEHMKSWALYNEAFAHAVGKYSAIMDIKSPLYEKVSKLTRSRLERAHLDLIGRQHTANSRLESFDFPSIFAGVASSTSYDEYKNLRFSKWKHSFSKMRSFVQGYYKSAFGHWPPKASSKKNTFSESGLNRQVLKVLYSDLCSLYDLVVDRENITPRVIDELPDDIREVSRNPMISALRKLLSEFDHSSPPVLPPIPYDVPKLPSMASVHETYSKMNVKDQLKFDRKIQSHELQLILLKSHNIDTDRLNLPFLNAFKEFELKEAKGCTETDLAEQRVGYWIFLYVVIQCLPMLVVDAPGLKYTEGVEYFLCQPPVGNLPWMEGAGQVRKVWYEISGSEGIVELSADVVMFSVEATYHRSHCWLAAKIWEGNGPAQSAPLPAVMTPLEPPRPMFPGTAAESVRSMTPPGSAGIPLAGTGSSLPVRPRNASPLPAVSPNRQSRQSNRSSIAFGLEPINLPADGVPGDGSGRVVSGYSGRGTPPAHSRNSSRVRSASISNLAGAASDTPPPESGGSTFDDILKGIDGKDKKANRKSKFGIL